jgi:hypothetical protein
MVKTSKKWHQTERKLLCSQESAETQGLHKMSAKLKVKNKFVELRDAYESTKEKLSKKRKGTEQDADVKHFMLLDNRWCEFIDGKNNTNTAIYKNPAASYKTLSNVDTSFVSFVFSRPEDQDSRTRSMALRTEFHEHSFKIKTTNPKIDAMLEGLEAGQRETLNSKLGPVTAVDVETWSITRVASATSKNSVPSLTMQDESLFSEKTRLARIAGMVLCGETGMNFNGAGGADLSAALLLQFLTEHTPEPKSPEAVKLAKSLWNNLFALADRPVSAHVSAEDGMLIADDGSTPEFCIVFTVDFETARVPWLSRAQDYRVLRHYSNSTHRFLKATTKFLTGGDDAFVDSLIPPIVKKFFDAGCKRLELTTNLSSVIQDANAALPSIKSIDKLDFEPNIEMLIKNDEANCNIVRNDWTSAPWCTPTVSVTTSDGKVVVPIFLPKNFDLEVLANIQTSIGKLDVDGCGFEDEKDCKLALHEIAHSCALSVRANNVASALVVRDGTAPKHTRIVAPQHTAAKRRRMAKIQETAAAQAAAAQATAAAQAVAQATAAVGTEMSEEHMNLFATKVGVHVEKVLEEKMDLLAAKFRVQVEKVLEERGVIEAAPARASSQGSSSSSGGKQKQATLDAHVQGGKSKKQPVAATQPEPQAELEAPPKKTKKKTSAAAPALKPALKPPLKPALKPAPEPEAAPPPKKKKEAEAKPAPERRPVAKAKAAVSKFIDASASVKRKGRRVVDTDSDEDDSEDEANSSDDAFIDDSEGGSEASDESDERSDEDAGDAEVLSANDSDDADTEEDDE